MSLTDKTIGHGTTFSFGGTTIARIRSITPPTKSREDVEATTLDSTIVDYHPSDPPDMGEVMLDLVWKPGETNDEILDTAFAAKTNGACVIGYPASVGVDDAFTAYVKTLAPAVVESKTIISRQVTLKLTSAITRS